LTTKEILMQHRDEDEARTLPHDQRLSAIAGILAAGILRLRARAALPPSSEHLPGLQIPPESGPNCLELPPETGLSVHTG
jgi:hypothetical protein